MNPSATLSSGKHGAPAAAVFAGGFWGGCLYLFYTAGPAPAADPLTPAGPLMASAIAPSAWLLALLIVIPAVYVGLATLLARGSTGILSVPRTIAFQLLTLALGWTLIEVVVHLHNPSRAHDGLLTGSQGAGSQLHWLARVLGYVLLAFLVACANASLVGILSSTLFSFPASPSLAGSPNTPTWTPSQGVLAIQSWILRRAHPRAPPI